MTPQELIQYTKSISNNYFICLNQIHENKFSETDGVQMSSPFYKYYMDVELAFSKLCKPFRKIINNEFFYQSYPGWWKPFYPEDLFNKVKQIAIKEFVEAFYEIHY